MGHKGTSLSTQGGQPRAPADMSPHSLSIIARPRALGRAKAKRLFKMAAMLGSRLPTVAHQMNDTLSARKERIVCSRLDATGQADCLISPLC